MILPIYAYGMPVLRKKAEDITPQYEGLDTLLKNMFETMYDSSGIGLAAPQIGLPIRLFIVGGRNSDMGNKWMAVWIVSDYINHP